MSNPKKQYTGVLHQNTRDIHTTTPKVYISRIKDEEGNTVRDHCWVPLSKNLDSIRPFGMKPKSLRISFTAIPYSYQAFDKEGYKSHTQIGLKSLKNIKVLGVFSFPKKKQRKKPRVKELPWNEIKYKEDNELHRTIKATRK